MGHAVAGDAGLLLLLATAVGLAVLAARRRVDFALGAAAVMQACAVGGLLWLEDDWMGEYRFATAAVALSVVVAIMVSHVFLQNRRWALATGWVRWR